MQTRSTQRQVCRRIEVLAKGTGNIHLPRGWCISTACANQVNSTPGVQKDRGFGQGHGKHSPSQGRIDAMFDTRPSTQMAQTDNASKAVRAEVDDSSECSDDATDMT